MRRAVLIAAASAATVAAGMASADAPRARVSGLHDARYCEIIELKGLPPHARATVWNTIGQNRCPEALWRSFDAGTLAQELGDTFIVLNGPRHFLMDSASAVTGGHRAFHGLQTTKVATIALPRAADLVRTPYTDRTITRDNDWRWRKGRTLYELVAPGGDVYVMQSYAQIKDPGLTLAKLPALGRRLTLPPGWRYRTRRLRRPFVLSVKRSATIVQDEFQDTYQLATPPARGRRRSHAVSMSGHTRTVAPATPGTVEDHGTVTGSPFGTGTIVLVGKLAAGRLTATYRLTFPRGSVTGTASLPFTVSGETISFRGTSRFTAGTGAYRNVRSGALQVRDHNTRDGQHGVLTVKGSASYRVRW